MNSELKTEEFKLFQEFICENSGLHFNESMERSLKISLLARLRYKGFENYQQYYTYIKYHPDGDAEFRDLLSSLTINETSFFRNPEQFRVFKNFIIPILKEKNTDRNIRIWSAGCSTGEEPYSVAMSILEVIDSPDLWNIEILATTRIWRF